MIPRVYKRVPTSDFSMEPVKVSKKYSIYTSEFSNNGYINRDGIYHFLLTPVGAIEAENDPMNSDGSYKSIIWHSIKHQYYNPDYTKEHPFHKTYRYLSHNLSVIATPYAHTGEMIKPGTVRLINENYEYDIVDDGKGNLYKSNRSDIARLFFERHKSICEWDLSTLYSMHRGYKGNLSRDILHGYYRYNNKSNYTANSYYNNCTLVKDDSIIGFKIESDSYVRTNHDRIFNFESGNFFIHFKLYISDVELVENKIDIISTNKIRKKKNKGLQVLEDNVSRREVEIIYETDDTTESDVYPFYMYLDRIDNQTVLIFKRSDGEVVSTISSNTINEWNDFQICRYVYNGVYKISLYQNGVSVATITDNTKYTFNDYDLVFGNITNVEISNSSEILLGDIKFYNTFNYNNPGHVHDLAQNLVLPQNYYGGYIGNVFYRNGNIVLTPRLDNDINYFNTLTKLEYESVYTIYEYEALCRIGKGDFNITQNPTARIHYDSDVFIEEIQNGTLNPYFTTIGLYNQQGELLVVGKMGQPVQVRDDVDINIAIRWSA